MMRNYLWCMICFASLGLNAQKIDSTALRQVDSLLKVSRNFGSKGDFDKALEHIGAAEKIAILKEHGFGPVSAVYARCAHDRGRMFYLKGDWSESEKWHCKALAIREKALGKEHYEYVVSLNNVAFMNEKLGNYEKAEPLYLEAVAILEKTSGKENFGRTKCLNSLAILYQQMGLYEKAEPIQLEVKAIREKTLGKEHIDYAATLNNLAMVYWSMKAYEKAEPLILEARGIMERLLGKEHPDYGRALNTMGSLYHHKGDYQKAESLYLEGSIVLEKALGKENSEYAANQNSLGELYFRMGEYEKAGSYLKEAFEIWSRNLGKQHPYCAIGLLNLANLSNHTGKFDDAEVLYTQLSELSSRLSIRALQHLSEREMDSYLQSYTKHQEATLSFAQTSKGRSAATCFDNALFFKGFLLNAAGQLRRLALLDTAAFEKFELLKILQRKLAAQYAQPLAAQTDVENLEAQANHLEKDLARTVKGYDEAMQQVKWRDVRRVLKPGEAAVEFVHYAFSQAGKTEGTMYAALVVQAGSVDPQFIPLFEENRLATLLTAENKPSPDFYNSLYANNQKGKQLYDLIWEPVVAALPGVSTIYCSPSGLLHRLNLGAIPAPDGQICAEKYRITILGSTRQLVVPPVSSSGQNTSAALFGGIQYDAEPVIVSNTTSSSDDITARRGIDFTQNDSTLRGESWHFLRWTEVEIAAVAELMKTKGIAVTLHKAAEATEESFKKMGRSGNSPRILHVATHGFFFPDPRVNERNKGLATGEKTFKVSPHPMIRSGLVLAGANHAWKTGKPLRPDLEDGILTAYEISQLNLSNTELAVLSACETGLGDLVGNEGVYGLQRAFKMTGARYLIMSLWQVPDFQTQIFMNAFYKYWLDKKMSVPEAFSATQSELRVKYGEAFKWAGFVLVR